MEGPRAPDSGEGAPPAEQRTPAPAAPLPATPFDVAAAAPPPATPGTPFFAASGAPLPGAQPRACYTDTALLGGRLPSLFERPGGGSASPVRGGGGAAPADGGASPATARTRRLARSFRAAKAQADRDLAAILAEAAAAAPAAPAADASALGRLAALARRCLEEDVDAFRGAVKAAVDEAEEARRTCGRGAARALATRTLFALARCSRLVPAEGDGPGSAGSSGGVRGGTVGPAARGAGARRRFAPAPTPLPARALLDALAGLRVGEAAARRPALSPTAESPGGAAGSPGAGRRAAAPAPSPLGRPVVTALEAQLEEAAARRTPRPRRLAVASPAGSPRARAPAAASPLASPARAPPLAAAPSTALPPPSIDDYEILKPISRGAFGRVYLARERASGALFAVKVLRKADLVRKNMVEGARVERSVLAAARNPFVVRFHASFTSRENLYLVMEYAPGGDLASLLRALGALDERAARQYAAEVALALEYCHALGVVHRDVKVRGRKIVSFFSRHALGA
jgi:hypothetical protein